jgi:hypothetical protein
MSRTTAMIGIHPEELRWIRILLALLRHPDPGMPELARQALLYLSQSADQPAASLSATRPL